MNILFVCSGNTCRSPMAEAIFKSKTKEYENYCNVLSCGLGAMPGDTASDGAVKAMADRGIDITSHRARQINRYLIEEADYIFCMGLSHYNALRPFAENKVYLLGNGISDPYGGNSDVYTKCADEIEKEINNILMSDIFFRTEAMSINDIEIVSEIEKSNFSEPWSKDSFVSQIKKNYALCFTEKYLGKPVGYICADNISGEIYIGTVAVENSMRRRGAADRLLEALDGFADKNKSSLITLEVRVSNIPALNLYGKHGFKVVGKRKNFYREPSEDAYIMTKFFDGDKDENTCN